MLRDVGRRIAELRSDRGLTQERLAELVDVSTRYLQRVERGGASASLLFLARVAEALDAKMPELFEAPRSRDVKVGRPKRPKS